MHEGSHNIMPMLQRALHKHKIRYGPLQNRAYADTANAVLAVCRPKSMEEYCYEMVLQRCYNGPQGNDRRFQQKACRQNELQHLSKALGVDFVLGVEPGDGQDPQRNGSMPISPELNREELAAMQCSWQGLTVRLVNHRAHYCLGIETNQVHITGKCSMLMLLKA